MKLSFGMQSSSGQTASRNPTEALEAALLLVAPFLGDEPWKQLMDEMTRRMGLEYVRRIEEQAKKLRP